jgi:NitT/TauT family transport system substrate-binding protein
MKTVSLLRSVAFLLLVSFAGMLWAQALPLPGYKPLPAREKIRIASASKNAVWAPWYLGKATGDFEKENIEVEYSQVPSSDMLVLLATGRMDVGTGAFSAGLFNAIAQGATVRVVAPSSLNPPESRQGVYVNTAFLQGKPYNPAMLKGQTILSIVGHGSPITVYIARELAKAGLTFTDVTLRQMGGADIPVALANGAANFGFITDPFWLSVDPNKVRLLFLNEGDYSTGVYTFGQSLLNDKRAVGEAFIRVIVRMQRQYLQGKYMSNPTVQAALVKELEVPLASITRFPEHHFQPNLPLLPKAVSELQEVFGSVPGILAYPKPLTDTQVFDRRFLEAALPR